MSDPFARKTYLHAVPGEPLPLRFSVGKRLRALQLQSFLRGLHGALDETPADTLVDTAINTVTDTAGGSLELVVLTSSDWRRLLSAPYGWGVTRRTDSGISVALPAGYPPRLIARWDVVRLRAAQAGVRAPGSVTAFLDALSGLEWAHGWLLGSAAAQGKRSRPWLREVSASYLYQRALVRLGDTHKLAYLGAWAQLQQAGTAGETSGELGPQAFAYPRAKLPFTELLAAQSALWLQAAELGAAHGWALPDAEVQRLVKAELGPDSRRPLETL